MGLVLLFVIWLITLVSTYFFVAKTWWLPPGASASAALIDHHFAITYILMGIVFVAAQLILGYFVWKYRDRGTPSPASTCRSPRTATSSATSAGGCTTVRTRAGRA